jgi:hypothetical protein
MLAGMALALVSAALADGDTGFEQGPHDVGVVLGRPAQHPACRNAHVRALQAQPYAFHHVGEILLAQVGVGVGDAGLDAIVQRVEGIAQESRIEGRFACRTRQDLPCVAHVFLQSDQKDREVDYVAAVERLLMNDTVHLVVATLGERGVHGATDKTFSYVGYSSFRQARGSAGWAFGVRSSRKL